MDPHGEEAPSGRAKRGLMMNSAPSRTMRQIRDDGSTERKNKNGSVATGRVDIEPNSLARSGQILQRVQADLGCPVLFEKIFFFQPDPNHSTDSRRPVP